MALRFNVLNLNSMVKLPKSCKCQDNEKLEKLSEAVIHSWIEYCEQTGMDLKMEINGKSYKLEKLKYG